MKRRLMDERPQVASAGRAVGSAAMEQISHLSSAPPIPSVLSTKAASVHGPPRQVKSKLTAEEAMHRCHCLAALIEPNIQQLINSSMKDSAADNHLDLALFLTTRPARSDHTEAFFRAPVREYPDPRHIRLMLLLFASPVLWTPPGRTIPQLFFATCYPPPFPPSLPPSLPTHPHPHPGP